MPTMQEQVVLESRPAEYDGSDLAQGASRIALSVCSLRHAVHGCDDQVGETSDKSRALVDIRADYGVAPVHTLPAFSV